MGGFLQDPANWVALSFTIFALAFLRYGWGKVTTGLDSRIGEIRDELAQAETLKTEAQAMLVEYQRKHAEAMREAETIAAHAREQAQALRARAEAEMKETLARREKQLQDRLARIEAQAEADLRRATAALALRASEALIRKGLDAKAQGALVDKAITALPGHLN
ncbi:MAG: F0F1 ATP synthase subunit B [Alphaproteobacteria bacterium]|nr:F0F1 ATP synthase subunit B [Alphaproteobacteria bacterium]USO07637.1 MAG: F0F1 ATP synthase subunit B [Rhodospirillales bacterium]